MSRKRWLLPWKDSREKPVIYHCISRVVKTLLQRHAQGRTLQELDRRKRGRRTDHGGLHRSEPRESRHGGRSSGLSMEQLRRSRGRRMKGERQGSGWGVVEREGFESPGVSL